MKSPFSALLTLTLALVIAAPGAADEKKPKREKKPGAKKNEKAGPGARAFNLPKTIELTAEQQEQVKALHKEYAPRLKELNDKRMQAVGPEVQQKRQEAMKAARQAGKKGKELKAAVEEAVSLTADQQAALDDVQTQVKALNQEIRGKLENILTEEQKSQLKPKRDKAPRKNKKNKENVQN